MVVVRISTVCHATYQNYIFVNMVGISVCLATYQNFIFVVMVIVVIIVGISTEKTGGRRNTKTA